MKLFLVSDLDMTLTLFKHNLALLELKSCLGSMNLFPPHADQIALFLHSCFNNFLAKARGLPYDEGLARLIEEAACRVENNQDADILWSRELWLYAAPGVAETGMSGEIAVYAAEAYWNAIKKSANMYEDVETFFNSSWWKNSQWELTIVTNSDARLYLPSGDNRLVYDPEYSDKNKRERVPSSLLQISSNNVFVGDPVGKPDPRFWKNVAMNLAYDPKEDVAVMVGDSPKNDLTGLPQGFVPIFIDRDNARRGGEVKEARFIIPSFDSLPFILENLETQAKERR